MFTYNTCGNLRYINFNIKLQLQHIIDLIFFPETFNWILIKVKRFHDPELITTWFVDTHGQKIKMACAIESVWNNRFLRPPPVISLPAPLMQQGKKLSFMISQTSLHK